MLTKRFIEYLYKHDIPVVETIGIIYSIKHGIKFHTEALRRVASILLAHKVINYNNDDELIIDESIFLQELTLGTSEDLSKAKEIKILLEEDLDFSELGLTDYDLTPLTDFNKLTEEYVSLFKERDPSMLPRKREVKKRLIALFKDNVDITYEEVLGATKLYLEREEYIRQTHYFICKGSGTSKIEDILTWIDVYREEDKQSDNRSSNNNTML